MVTAQTDLSIIIPIYRGVELVQTNLPILQDFLSRLDLKSEVLVVDDGSEDPQTCRAVTEQFGGVFLANPGNLGKGAAVRRGMLAASGRVRLFTDADLPYELEAITRAYAQVNDGFAVVVGDRTLSQSIYFDSIPGLRKLSSQIFSSLVRLLVLKQAYDTQCGFKAFHGQAAAKLFNQAKIDRFAMDVEILALAELDGFSIARIPVTLRNWESSGVNVLRDGFLMFLDLLRIRYYLITGAYRRTRIEG